MSDMDEMELAIARIEPEAGLDYVCETILRLEALMKRARELDKQLKAALTDYIKVNGDVTIGTVRYYLGHPKKTDCNSNETVLETMLELVGPKRTSGCLASNAWKPAAVKVALTEAGSPEVFDQLFTVTYGDKLEEGKPKEKQLQKLDTSFIH